MSNSSEYDWTLSQFCGSTYCIIEGHGEHPIEQFCLSPECKAPFKQMCKNCTQMHLRHLVVPITYLDNLNSNRLQADEVDNKSIDLILANINALRVMINKSLDQLDSFVQKTRQLSSKAIVDTFMGKSVKPATVTEILLTMQKNIVWNDQPGIQLKRMEWSQIEETIQLEIEKARKKIQEQMQQLVPEKQTNEKIQDLVNYKNVEDIGIKLDGILQNDFNILLSEIEKKQKIEIFSIYPLQY